MAAKKSNSNSNSNKKKGKGGRPTKFNDKVVKSIVENIKIGMPFHLAAKAAGISYQTFLDWMKKGEQYSTGQFSEFFDKVKAAEAEAAKWHMERIRESAKEGNWRASAWILEKRYPEDFGQRVDANVEHSGEVKLNLNIVDASIDPEEEDDQ